MGRCRRSGRLGVVSRRSSNSAGGVSVKTTRCLLAAWTLAGPVAGAATLRVMQDGSGDYTDIQAAVDASAHGDTIRIGPGQWNTFHPFYYSQVIAHNTQDRDLTFIGSGPDQTILGPSPGGPHDWNYFGIVSRYSQDTFRDLTVTGIYVGVEDISGGVDLGNCRFDDCSSGLVMFRRRRDGDRVRVRETAPTASPARATATTSGSAIAILRAATRGSICRVLSRRRTRYGTARSPRVR